MSLHAKHKRALLDRGEQNTSADPYAADVALALSDDLHPHWDDKGPVWRRGFLSGVSLAWNGFRLDQCGATLDHENEIHRGMVMGWRVADQERSTPMGHRFNVGLWGPVPTAAISC